MDDAILLADQVFEVTSTGAILTKENAYGVAPGLSPEVFFQEQQAKRAHWWPAAVGGDANGSGGNKGGTVNPWASESWNITEQGRYVTANGMDKAQQMAKLAGTTVGGPKSKPKATK
jgi:hypothetical protein